MNVSKPSWSGQWQFQLQKGFKFSLFLGKGLSSMVLTSSVIAGLAQRYLADREVGTEILAMSLAGGTVHKMSNWK